MPALAHRLMLKPELWVQRLSADDVVRDLLESVPTPPAEEPRTGARNDARRRRRASAAYAALAALFLLAALAPRPAGAGRRSPRRSRCSLALGLALARPPDLRVWLTARARARRSRATSVDARARRRVGRPVERLELLLVAARTASRSARATSAVSVRLGWDDERTLELPLALHALGRTTQLGDVRRARPRPARAARLGGSARPADAPLRVYPLPETLRADRPARVATQPFAGNQVARQKGEGLEFADLRAVRARRPRPVDQLARERPPRRRARRQRAPPGAERRRDPLPRHVRRGARRRPRRRSTSPCARPPTLATRYLERA